MKRLNGIKILVVDDAYDNRKLIEILLKREGAIVEMASDGEMAVKMAFESDYDVVLMDIQMPGTDGYEALSKLQMNGYRKPVIALTAHTLLEEKTRAIAAGFSEHIPKPISAVQLTETLMALTQNL